jgi:apolipoprotein N-acyltransferase
MRPMAKVERADYRRVGAAPEEPVPPFAQTFRGRVVLVLLCVGMLSLAYAPFKQFYLAWVGLVPWLVLVGNARSTRSAFLWSWVTGIGFFSVNIWWIGWVTIPGAMGLMLYMGVWFALNALVLRGAGVLEVGDAAKPQAAWKPVVAVVVIAGTWVAQEWIRGNLFTGLPWLYLGHTQSPVLAMCQVADLASVYGVTFWVVLINAWVALWVLHRLNPARLVGAGVLVVGVLAATLGYGVFRMGQKTSYPGPTVLVVQPNYPQSNSGEKGASFDEIVEFHIRETVGALKRIAPDGGADAPDLVAWSETMMPELNADYRRFAYKYVFADNRERVVGEFLDQVNAALERLAKTYGVSLIVGGHTMVERGKGDDGKPVFSRYNSAYYYTPAGGQAKERYDKIHLVPFGEFMPFRESFPLLYRAFNVFNPYKDLDYTVESGKELTVFQLPARGRGRRRLSRRQGGRGS